MKILLFNQVWFADEWRQAGHEVVTWGPDERFDIQRTFPIQHIGNILSTLPNGFQPDVLVFHDNSSPVMIAGLDEIDIPTIFYSVDTHHHYELHGFLYEVFDELLVAQKDYIAGFQRQGQEPIWFPLWASRLMEPSDDKKYGAVFVGTLNPKLNPERVAFFEALATKVPIVCMTGEFWKIFPHAEVVVNQTVKGDLNFRVFEAMASGAMLLTEHTGNGLLEIFRDGTELRTYTHNDVDMAASRISEALDNLKFTREIGRAGRESILRSHTSAHRAAAFLEIIKQTKKKSGRRLKHLSNALNFSIVGKKCEKVDDAATQAALMVSLRAMELGLQQGEVMTRAISIYLLRAALVYERLVGCGAGLEVIRKMREAYRDELIFTLGYVQMLVNAGNLDAARQQAGQISPEDPNVTLYNADQVVQAVLAS